MATEKRLIDANALSHFMCRKCNDAYSNELCEPCDCIFLNAIDESPTVDAVEAKHGRWIFDEPDNFGCRKPRCSVCGKYELYLWADSVSCNYCPNCGAKMDGERKDND